MEIDNTPLTSPAVTLLVLPTITSSSGTATKTTINSRVGVSYSGYSRGMLQELAGNKYCQSLVANNGLVIDRAAQCQEDIMHCIAVSTITEDNGHKRGKRMSADAVCSYCGNYCGSNVVAATKILSTNLVSATAFCTKSCAESYYTAALSVKREHLLLSVLNRIQQAFSKRRLEGYSDIEMADNNDAHEELYE